MSSIDTSVARGANRFAAHHDTWEDVAGLYAAASQYLFAGLCAVLIVAGLLTRHTALAVAGALAGVAAGSSLVVAHVLAGLVDRQRPFAGDPQIHAFLHHAADGSFPSEHATAAFAIAGVLLMRLGWRWWPVLVAAVLLAVARVLLGLHYPLDVTAGAALGLGAAWAVCALARLPALPAVVRGAPAQVTEA